MSGRDKSPPNLSPTSHTLIPDNGSNQSLPAMSKVTSGRGRKRAKPEVMASISENPEFEPSQESYKSGHWSHEEHMKYLEALREFGHDWTKISAYIESRTAAQARSHNQKVEQSTTNFKQPKMQVVINSFLNYQGNEARKEDEKESAKEKVKVENGQKPIDTYLIRVDAALLGLLTAKLGPLSRDSVITKTNMTSAVCDHLKDLLSGPINQPIPTPRQTPTNCDVPSNVPVEDPTDLLSPEIKKESCSDSTSLENNPDITPCHRFNAFDDMA